MTAPNDDLPGVTFHKKSSELAGKTFKGHKRIRIVLEAEVSDDAVWDVVEKKLDGLKVYSSDDFKGEMLSSLRLDYLKLEEENKRLNARLGQALEENVHMKSALSVLNHQLEG